MNLMLELPHGDCKAAITKMLQQIIINYVKTNDKIQNISKKKKEISELKITAWAQ